MVKPQEGVESTNTPSAEERKVSSEYTEIAQNWNHSEAEAYVKVRKDCACPFFWVCFISPHLVVFGTWISPCTQASVQRAQGSSLCSQASRAQVQLLAWPQLGALFPNSPGGDFLPSSLSLHFFFPSFPAAVPPEGVIGPVPGPPFACPSTCTEKYHGSTGGSCKHVGAPATGAFHCAPRPGPRTNCSFVKWRPTGEGGEGKSSSYWSQWAGSNH